jgi:hypothetical protein
VASPLAVGPQSGFGATDSVPVGKYPVVSIAKPAAQTRTPPTESHTATSDLMRNTAGINEYLIANKLPFYCGRLTEEWHRIQGHTAPIRIQ